MFMLYRKCFKTFVYSRHFFALFSYGFKYKAGRLAIAYFAIKSTAFNKNNLNNSYSRNYNNADLQFSKTNSALA